MDVEKLRNDLASDPVARARFIASTLEYYRSLGVNVTEDLAKDLTTEAVKDAATNRKKVASTNNIITIF